MLTAKQRIGLNMDTLAWLSRGLSYPSMRLLPITPEIAVRAYNLPEPFHRDPADRMLVATALEHSSPLVTSDERIILYPHASTIN